MKYFKISIGIFLALAASRFVPHPPNFTSLQALSFYVPALIGFKFLPAVVISFFITDLFIGIHSITFFTWGSVFIIGLLSLKLKNSIKSRLLGSLLGACLFFVITNFGVWLVSELYEKSIDGLLSCYILAIPFFKNTMISTILFSATIEFVYNIYKTRLAKSFKQIDNLN